MRRKKLPITTNLVQTHTLVANLLRIFPLFCQNKRVVSKFQRNGAFKCIRKVIAVRMRSCMCRWRTSEKSDEPAYRHFLFSEMHIPFEGDLSLPFDLHNAQHARSVVHNKIDFDYDSYTVKPGFQ